MDNESSENIESLFTQLEKSTALFYEEENVSPNNSSHGKKLDALKKCGFPDMIFIRLAAVYLILSGINIRISVRNNIHPISMWKEYINSISFVSSILWVTIGFIILTVIHVIFSKKYKFTDSISMFAGIMIFGISVVWRSNDFYLGIGVSLVSIVLISCFTKKTKIIFLKKISDCSVFAIIVITAFVVAIFIAVTTIYKHMMYGTTCFDLGIFIQMFHSMITNCSAVTTCERGEAISHFYIHASYVYYFLVPFYALFPRTETLLIAQSLLAMGGIFPFFLIAKKHKFSGMPLIAVCFLYVFCSGIISPCNYDFHENAFLPTLLMWTLYAFDQKKIALIYIMSPLVCIVKEDAPLYIICISLFFFFNEKYYKKRHILIVLLLSIIYFILINSWLIKYGDGNIMISSRFGNLTVEREENFLQIIKNILIDPGYFISLMIKENTLLFFMQIMFPILFLPFMTRKIHRFLLMIPFVIMNLVVGAGYQYAAKIGYQYIWGPVCLLLYMSVVNAEELNFKVRKPFIYSAAIVSVITACSLSSGNLAYFDYYTSNIDHFKAIDNCLNSIPKDASVASDNTWYIPHIADRSEVYYLSKSYFTESLDEPGTRVLKEIEPYDFYILSSESEDSDAIARLEEAGYSVFNYIEGTIIVFKNPNYFIK